MKNKILTTMGVVMLICFIAVGALALPVGMIISGAIGLVYGIKYKDKQFIIWCSLALFIGSAFIANLILSLKYM